MKTFYCVATTICNNGDVTSSIVSSKVTEERPLSTMNSSAEADCYWDWFDSPELAQEFINLTLKM